MEKIVDHLTTGHQLGETLQYKRDGIDRESVIFSDILNLT